MIQLRRRMAIASAALLALSALPVLAQPWPSKPITLIVPFPAGGTTDVLARALADKLSPVLGQTVIVESKPGAGATLGADFVAKSKPDGYTLLVGAVHHTIASSVYKKLPYDFQKDLLPITTIALVPNVLVVNPATPAKNVAELVALLKAKPGAYSYGSNGNGTAQHLIGTQFQNATGTEMVHIPYKGSGPATMDLIGGQAQVFFATVPTILGQVKGDKVRLVATTAKSRTRLFPNVPTVQESGVKDFHVETWWGIVGPPGVPADVVAALNKAINAAAAGEEMKKRFETEGADPHAGPPSDLANVLRDELEGWRRVVREGGLKVE